MRIEISKLHQKLGTTIIYVTHDQTEAMTLGTRIVVMKDGVIQQVDTPESLYSNPVNKFVAGFIGSPQMNFLTGRISEANGSVYIHIGDTNLTIPESKAERLRKQNYIGKDVTLGIRPEDIHDTSDGVIHSSVKVYELLGAEAYLYFDMDDTQVTARINPRFDIKPGSRISVSFDMEKAHFFDPETELAIRP